MTYLLDTNTLSDLMKERAATTVRWEASSSSGHRVLVMIVSIGEIMFGVERLDVGRRRERYARALQEVAARLTVIALPNEAAPIYGRIKASTQSIGRAVGDNDLWIAATAIHLDATVVTRDQDFAAVVGLRREAW